MSKIRKWNDDYVAFGFTTVNRNGLDCAQCLHCSYVMSNASLRPSKLANHRDKKHPQIKIADIETMSVKRARYDRKASITRFDNFCKKKSLPFNAAMRWHIELRSAKSRTLLRKTL